MIFRYTILYVADVKATLDFYRRAFGFETGFVTDGNDYGELKTGDTKLAFSSVSLMKQLGKSPAAADPKRPVFEIAFETDDVPGALKRAVDAGATLVQGAETMQWGQTVSYVSDPNGCLVEICSPVPSPS